MKCVRNRTRVEKVEKLTLSFVISPTDPSGPLSPFNREKGDDRMKDYVRRADSPRQILTR